MKKRLHKPSVMIVIVLFVTLNLILSARYVSESWKVEDICSDYVNKLETPKDKDSRYWVEKISPEEYTQSEKRWADLGRDVTRERRAIIKCEEEQDKQIKYFIFF